MAETKSYITYLTQNLYFANLFLQIEIADICLNISSLDMVAKVYSNEFSNSIFWAGVEEFLFK